MNGYQQASLVLSLAEALRRYDSWTGETHLHKTMYFLEDLLGVPAGLKFILYKHGPYSFELLDTIGLLEANDFLRWQPQAYPYGASAVPGPASEQLKKAYPKIPKLYTRQIEFVASHLASKSVRELEKLATALWVIRREHEGTVEADAAHINKLKPHIPLPDAIDALRAVDDLDRQAREADVQLSTH